VSVALHPQAGLGASLLLEGSQVHHHQDFQDAEDRHLPVSHPRLDSNLQVDLEDLPADSNRLPDSSHQDRDEDTRRQDLVGDEVGSQLL